MFYFSNRLTVSDAKGKGEGPTHKMDIVEHANGRTRSDHKRSEKRPSKEDTRNMTIRHESSLWRRRRKVSILSKDQEDELKETMFDMESKLLGLTR